jgi:hypothetical protein
MSMRLASIFAALRLFLATATQQALVIERNAGKSVVSVGDWASPSCGTIAL